MLGTITMKSAAFGSLPDPTYPVHRGDGHRGRHLGAGVIDAAVTSPRVAYKIHSIEVLAGEKVFNKPATGSPDQTITDFKNYLVGIKARSPPHRRRHPLSTSPSASSSTSSASAPVRLVQGVPAPVAARRTAR